MGDTTRRRMVKFAREYGLEIREIVRVALTREQVDTHNIPTRPQKDTTHRRADDDPDAAELDAVLALHPGLLEEWIAEAVDAYWTTEERAPALAREQDDRADLAALAARWPEVARFLRIRE